MSGTTRARELCRFELEIPKVRVVPVRELCRKSTNQMESIFPPRNEYFFQCIWELMTLLFVAGEIFLVPHYQLSFSPLKFAFFHQESQNQGNATFQSKW